MAECIALNKEMALYEDVMREHGDGLRRAYIQTENRKCFFFKKDMTLLKDFTG